MTTSTTARGTCAVCGTRQPLTKNGTVRAHGSTDQLRRCIGSGWVPAATA